MPIALDPNQTIEFSLVIDGQDEGAPVFACRFMTARECVLFDQRVAAARDARTRAEENEHLYAALGLTLITWRDVRDRDGREIPFAIERLGDVLTTWEMIELCAKLARTLVLTELAKKNSASPRESTPAGPAATASPASATTTAATAADTSSTAQGATARTPKRARRAAARGASRSRGA